MKGTFSKSETSRQKGGKNLLIYKVKASFLKLNICIQKSLK
nr:MAG TPA: hypothetical protein [Caudoviricetes sp.]